MRLRVVLTGLRNRLRAFTNAERGNVLFTFALALVPIMGSVGAALDYSRASAARTALQASLDAALLAGARDGSANWASVALNVFKGTLTSKDLVSVDTPSLTAPDNVTFAGSVTASIDTTVLRTMGINSIKLNAKSSASYADADNSCILTLDKGQPTSHISLTLNGAPVINLSGCSIRSNTSLDCNGHDGNVTKSFASGSATACGKPKSNAPAVPDTYAELAKNITSECGGARVGVTWTPGVLPMGAGIKTFNKATHIEYHICGDLTVSGSGTLISGGSDVVIVIENGNLIVDDKANISTARTAFVLTGNNSWPSKIVFPQGNGKSANLSLSPPTNTSNPWQAVALYQDPKLTKDVDNKWGPGAGFHADGLVYLGNSNVVTDGNTSSANSKCTKFVMNQFTTNGSVKLDFAQTNCSAIGLKQWGGIVVHLVK